MDFFLVNYSINNQLFVHSCEQSSQFFTAPDTHPGVGGEFPDNSVFKRQNLLSFIIQPSKTKTSCQNHQNLLSKHQNHQNQLSKSSKPAVKTSKPSKPAVKTSKPSKPPVKIIKTYCQNIKTIKTCCQNIKTIKTTCQNHQNLLSITSKPSKPPVKTSKPTVMTT